MSASEDALEYVRDHYGVPAFKNRRVIYNGKPGVIKGGKGAYVLILLDGETKKVTCHPTWEMVYLEDETTKKAEV
jgi:hypothetical protein